MMRGLVIPEKLAGARIERKQAIGVEIRSVAIGAVEVVGRRAGGEVRDASLFINRELAPRVCSADVLPGLRRPRLVARFSWTRHRVECPRQLSGNHVVGAEVARRRFIFLAGG